MLISHFVPSIGDPYLLSVNKFCEIADDVIPWILRIVSGNLMDKQEAMAQRLMERERNPDLNLPKTKVDEILKGIE